jgi:UDP-GlcNAc:undecaprenyl-phosphate/decaprenyl-phosphate GlcNAc-1-phosphate transferase
MNSVILGFITAFLLTYIVIPSIIRVAKQKKLFDAPNERSSHVQPTPSLGGIAIFAGAICGIILWTPFEAFGVLQYILAAFVIMFLVGVKDDLMPLSPITKLVGQILCAVILVYKSHIKITSLYGIAGVNEIPELFSFVLSIVAIVGVINAFNLIDGINGLAGGIGLLICLVFGSWFFLVNHIEIAIIAFSLAGAIIAFLKYNLSPSKIFMGDTGSLHVGMVCAILAIKFIELHKNVPQDKVYFVQSAPAIAICVLIIPLVDTARVFAIRLSQGKSPFHPDKNHIHHLLINIGLSHSQAALTLVIVNTLFVLMGLSLSWLGTTQLIGLTLLIAFSLATALNGLSTKAKNRTNNISA